MFPRRLTFIQMADTCMFCDNPKGESKCYYVYLQTKMGYISCNNCHSKMEEAVKEWNEQLAYGRANYLKETEIKIKRSSGEIEDGWIIDNPFSNVSDTSGLEMLHCFNKEKNLNRWCNIDDLLELNPPKETANEIASEEAANEIASEETVHKNLCLDCGIDMGDCNPRQLCGKWRCIN
jgi:hypothetical protein